MSYLEAIQELEDARHRLELTDKELKDPRLLVLLTDENIHQITKWGIQTHSPFEWLTYTTEELGELAQAISDHYYRGAPKQQIVKEAIQVATLALKIAEMHLEEK